MERDTFLAVILGAVFGGLLGFFGPIAYLLLLVLCGDLPDQDSSFICSWCFLVPCLAFFGSLIGYILAEEVGFRKLPPIPKDDTREPDDTDAPRPDDANQS